MNFLVLAAGRSGSTMLVNYLSSHPNVRCHHEPFNQNGWHKQIKDYDNVADALDHLDQYGLSIPLYSKISSSIQKGIGLHRGRLVADPFKNKNKIKLEGFKITWSQTDLILESIQSWLSQKSDVKILYLYRYDYLARFVSYHLAHTTGVWNSSHKQSDHKPFKASTISFKNFCDSEMRLEEKILKTLLSLNPNVSFLSYEDLVSDPTRAINKQLNFLGCDDIDRLNLFTRKLIIKPLDQLVSNFADLDSELSNKTGNENRLKWIDRIISKYTDTKY